MTLDEVYRMIDEQARGLIFDMDGTLTDSNPAHLKAWTRACKAFGMKYPKEKFYYYAGLSSLHIARDLIRQSGLEGKVDPEALSARKEQEFFRVEEMVKPVPEVLEIVRRYQGRLPLAVGTGRRRSSTTATLEHLDLLKYFDVIITADDVTRHKPEPDTFLECARHMGVPPDRCVVFEDAERGLEAARRAGMIVVNVTMWLPPMVTE